MYNFFDGLAGAVGRNAALVMVPGVMTSDVAFTSDWLSCVSDLVSVAFCCWAKRRSAESLGRLAISVLTFCSAVFAALMLACSFAMTSLLLAVAVLRRSAR